MLPMPCARARRRREREKIRARTEASDDRGQRFPIEREIRGTETRDKGDDLARDAFHIFRNEPEKSGGSSPPRRSIERGAFPLSFQVFDRERREDKTQKREEISLVLLTVLSDSINPVVRSTCGGFCALTTVNCAPPRLLRVVVVDFLREMREKASRLVKTRIISRHPHRRFVSNSKRERQRERENKRNL